MIPIHILCSSNNHFPVPSTNSANMADGDSVPVTITTIGSDLAEITSADPWLSLINHKNISGTDSGPSAGFRDVSQLSNAPSGLLRNWCKAVSVVHVSFSSCCTLLLRVIYGYVLDKSSDGRLSGFGGKGVYVIVDSANQSYGVSFMTNIHLKSTIHK